MIDLMWQGNEGYGYWHAKVTVADGETSDYIKLNYDAQTSVAVYPDNRARCEYTLSSFEDLQAGTAKWIPWSLRDVRRDSSDTIVGVVSAVRLVSRNGAATMEVLAR